MLLLFSPGLQAKPLVIGGSGTDLGTFRILAEAFSKKNPSIEIKILPSMGSSGGIKALKHGMLDLALTSRALKDKEKSLDLISMHYASTPLVFAVASSSKQRNINTDQVLKIYTGAVKRWPDGSVVRPVLRPSTDSDTKIVLDSLIECKKCFYQAYQRRELPVAITDQESAGMIGNIPGGLGTSTLALILSENKPIKALALNNVVASADSLKNKTYPMYKNLYLVYNRQHNNQNLTAFLSFLTTQRAQSIFLNTAHLVVK